MVDEHAEVKTIFDGLHVESLMLRLLVTACKELIQRCQLVEDAEGGLSPQEELLGLAFFDRVNDDRSEARSLDLHNVHALVKLGNRLESRDEILFFTLLILNCKWKLSRDHNFIEPRNQETVRVAAADLYRALAFHYRVEEGLRSVLSVPKAKLA